MQIASALAGFSLGEADILRKAMGKKKAEVMAAQMEKFLDGLRANEASRRRRPRKIFDADGAVRRLRLQQVALGGLRLARLPDRLPQGELPGLLHGRAADLGAGQHRQDGPVHRRVPGDGHPGPAPGRERVGDVLHRGARVRGPETPRSPPARPAAQRPSGESPRARRRPLRPRRDQERRRGRGRGHARGAAGGRALPVALRLLRPGRPAGGEPAGGGELRQERLASTRIDARRSALFAAIDRAMEAGQKRQRDREQGQSSLFGMLAPERRGARRPPSGSPTRRRGRRPSGWPSRRSRSASSSPATRSSASAPSSRSGRAPPPARWPRRRRAARCRSAGSSTALRLIKTKKGDRMASFVLEDLEGSVETLVFPETYKKTAGRLADDQVVLVKGAGGGPGRRAGPPAGLGRAAARAGQAGRGALRDDPGPGSRAGTGRRASGSGIYSARTGATAR